MNLDTIGLVAGFLTTSAWLPQLFRTWKARSADGLSWPYLAILATGIALWITYGALTRNAPVVVANTITISFVIGVIAIKATAATNAHLGDRLIVTDTPADRPAPTHVPCHEVLTAA